MSEKIDELHCDIAKLEEKVREIEERGDYPLYMRLKQKYYYKKCWYSKKYDMLRFLLGMLRRFNPDYNKTEIRKRLVTLKNKETEVTEINGKLSDWKYMVKSLENNLLQMKENLCKLS